MSAPVRPPLFRRLFTWAALSTFSVPRDAIRFGLRRFRARTAIVQGSNSLTFAQLEDRVGRLVTVLKSRGVSHGSLVLSALDDGPELLELRFAAFEVGVKLASIAPWASVESLDQYRQLGRPVLLVLDERLSPALSDGLKARWPGASLTTGAEWNEALTSVKPTRSREKVRPSDVAAVGFTSGTTGTAKVLQTPQAALLTSLKLTAVNVRTPVGQREVMTTAIPLNGAGSGLVLPLALTGATLALPESREPAALVEFLRAQAVTRAFITPSQLLDLLDEAGFSREHLPSLRNVIYGTAPMPVPRLEEALRRLGPIFQQGYGMAEVLPPVSLLQMEQHVDAQGNPQSREVLRSVGWVVPQVQVRVVNGDLQDVAAGQLGEILVKSPTVFDGYWRLDGVDRSVFHQGFLRTGDFGTLRTDGLLTVLDRAVDRLTIAGVTHSARLLEEHVYDELAVKEACLVQRAPNEPVTLFVSSRRGRTVDPEVLRERLRAVSAEVASVQVLPALPRSRLQKLLRREVRALL